ncbi:MAG: hypothetical protein FWH19_05010 [Treponema sp.]|nr:hypothetical protein [Treponema sp.]
MGKIKSALEIALERTGSVKSDKGSIGQFESRQKGKKLANDFLEGSVGSLEEEIGKVAAGEQASLKQGIFDVLVSQISLPNVKEDLKRIEAVTGGLNTLIGGKRFGEIAKQLGQIMNQFLSDAAQFEETLKRQYAPKLRQKEEEISRRYGRPVKLDPFQDPEFVAFYNQSVGSLRADYQAAADQAKEEAIRLFNGE